MSDMRDRIHVQVKLFATLREGRFEAKLVEVGAATTIGDVIRTLGIPEKEVTLIFVNGRHAEPDQLLAGGDRLALFPPVGGG
jgi:sulfur-carrier protein